MGVLRRAPGETYVQNIEVAAKLFRDYVVICRYSYNPIEAALTAYNRGPGSRGPRAERVPRNCRSSPYSAEVLRIADGIRSAMIASFAAKAMP